MILEEVHKCIQTKKEYKGFANRQWGRHSIIIPGSKEDDIIANWMEQGLVFRWTTMMVNHHRCEEGKTIVGRNAVMFHFRNMNPVITKVQKRSQGNENHERWQLARFNQTKQMNIMLGYIIMRTLL